MAGIQRMRPNLAEAEKATAKASVDIRSDFEECRNYWLLEYPVLSETTRSIITLSFSRNRTLAALASSWHNTGEDLVGRSF
jgi:hypothetical protein